MRFDEAYVEITKEKYPKVNIGGKEIAWGEASALIQKAVKKIYSEMINKNLLDKFRPEKEPWDIVFKSNGDVVITDDEGGVRRVPAEKLGLTDDEVAQLKALGA